MSQNDQSLSDLLSLYMERRSYGDHKLATLVNKHFPELQLSRSNIRNWREGRVSTVRSWQQLASIAYALDLTEQETDQLLQAGKCLCVQHLWQDAAAANKKYLAAWITQPTPTQEATRSIQPQPSITYTDPQTINHTTPLTEEPRTALSRNRPIWLFVAVACLLVILTGIIFLQPNQETIETRDPSLLETEGVISFENTADVSIWQWETTCAYALSGASPAHTGQNYLAVAQEPSAPCPVFSHTLSLSAAPGEVIRFGGWINSPGNTTIEGRLELLTEPQASAVKPFTISRDLWHCQEITLVLPDNSPSEVEVRIWLDSPHAVTYHFDDLQLKTGSESICPPTVSLPWVDSFEEIVTWQSNGPCELMARETDAYSGIRFLAIETVDSDCKAIYRDFLQHPLASQTYYAAAWLRVPDEAPTWGELTVATGNDPIHLYGFKEQSGTPFIIYGNKWQCIETMLSVQNNDSNTIRVQLTFNGAPTEYHLDDVQISEQSICPNHPLTDLENGDFEDDLGRISWMVRFGCEVMILHDPATAQSGQRFLQVHDPGDGCFSIFQELYRSPQVDETYYLSAWVRAGDGLPWNGEIVIWALGDQVDKSTFRFPGSANSWQCVETTLTIKNEGHNQLRSEIYQHGAGRHTFFIDNVRFTRIPQCAHRSEGPVQNLVQYIPGPVYAGATVPVAAEISNMGLVTATGSVSYWVSDSENGESMNGEVLTEFLPHPVAGQNVWTFYEDVYLPIGLLAGNYYIVLEPHITLAGAEVEGSGVRVSLLVTVSECVPGPLYCDIPGDYWAWPELENWFNLGISRGCRSQTELNINRPFCPDMMVSRAVLAVFLMRHLYSGEFQPTEDYRGLFIDVAADHQWVLWIEAFQDTDFNLSSADCSVIDAAPVFCPDKSVSRGELAVYLAEILAWTLPETSVTPFTDVTGDSLKARAIAYMWEHGFIADNEPDCALQEAGRQFCPDAPLRRVHAAVYLVRAFAAADRETP